MTLAWLAPRILQLTITVTGVAAPYLPSPFYVHVLENRAGVWAPVIHDELPRVEVGKTVTVDYLLRDVPLCKWPRPCVVTVGWGSLACNSTGGCRRVAAVPGGDPPPPPLTVLTGVISGDRGVVDDHGVILRDLEVTDTGHLAIWSPRVIFEGGVAIRGGLECVGPLQMRRGLREGRK